MSEGNGFVSPRSATRSRSSIPRFSLNDADEIAQHGMENSIKATNVYINPSFRYSIHGVELQAAADPEEIDVIKETLQVSTLAPQLQRLVKVKNPVPLALTYNISINPTDRRNSFERNLENTETSVGMSVTKLFQDARSTALQNACITASCSTQVAINSYIGLHGNTVSIVGRAGVGKSVFCQSMLQSHLSTADPNSYVFYVNTRNLNFEENISVLKFLTCSITEGNQLWTRKECEEILLDKVSKSTDVMIFLDGIDKAAHVNFSSLSAVTWLYQKDSPENIAKSLLSGHLLPNAKKVVVSRTDTFHHLHSAYKPHFAIKVTGLTLESRMTLCRRLCPVNSDYDNVTKTLQEQSNLKDLYHIPLYLTTLVKYITRSTLQDEAISVTDFFVSLLGDLIRTGQFSGSQQDIEAISKIAYTCKRNKTVSFPIHPLPNGVDPDTITAFCSPDMRQDYNGLQNSTPGSRYRFVDSIWLDFFAAFHLLHFHQPDVLLKCIKKFQGGGDHWETAINFLFGLCGPILSRKVDAICNAQFVRQLPDKVCRLKTFLTQSPMRFQHQILKLCRFVQESQHNDLQSSFVIVFPETISLRDCLMPYDVSSLSNVLKTVHKTVTIKCGSARPVSFSDSTGFNQFLAAANLRHKIQTMYVVSAKVKAPEIKLINKQLQNMTKLELVDCDITNATSQLIAEGLMGKKQPLEVLNLTKNRLTSLNSLSQCVHKALFWFVANNQIDGNGLMLFCSEIRRLTSSLKQLDISGNKISGLGIEHLAFCLSKMEILGLGDCGLTADDIRVLTTGIRKLLRPMNRLILDCNSFGDNGAERLASCKGKIEWLHLAQCDITTSGSQKFKDLKSVFGLPR